RLYLFSMPKLYERNIQQLRGSSYILTLPKEWVLESGLEKGSSVLLAVEPYFIRIVPATKQVKKTAKLMIDEKIKVEEIEEAIKWAYVSGIDELTIFRTEGIPHSIRNNIRKLRTVIPGMIISYEDSENLKVEFAEPTIKDFTNSLKTFLVSIKRIFQEIVNYIESKNVAESDLLILIEESVGNSLLLSRLASKSIIYPILNSSTMNIYWLIATTTNTIELTESVINVVDITKSYSIKSYSIASLIKDIISIFNNIFHLIDDLNKENFNNFITTIVNELNDFKVRIEKSDLDNKIKIALISCVEKIRMMIKNLSVYYLITAIYSY
ncbi:MAG: AbrB/MazE/SpoVT family DNA-binding domain-containing protein, partial [Nitrososphaerota archaeon]